MNSNPLLRLNKVFTTTLRTIFTDQGILIFCFLVPLFYPILYTFIYTGETVREVPAIVVDECNTGLSREYTRHVDATADVKIIGHAESLTAAREFIKSRDALGIIVIPKDFEKTIVHGGQAHVSIYVDMSGLLYYKAMLVANTDVSLAMNAEIRASKKAIKYEDVSLYNPQNGFAGFLIPAVLILILQQTLVLGIGLVRGTEHEMHSYMGFDAFRKMGDTQVLALGIGAAFLVVYVPISMYVLDIVPRIFSLNTIGNFWDMCIFILPFLLASIFFGLTLGAFTMQREHIILMVVFSSVPMLFFSGVSWPSSNIPDFWKGVGSLIPSTWAVNGYVKLNSTGAHLPQVYDEWIALWKLAGFYFLTAYFSIFSQIFIMLRQAGGVFSKKEKN